MTISYYILDYILNKSGLSNFLYPNLIHATEVAPQVRAPHFVLAGRSPSPVRNYPSVFVCVPFLQISCLHPCCAEDTIWCPNYEKYCREEWDL